MNRKLLALLLTLSITLGLTLPTSAMDLPIAVSNKGGGNEGEVSGPYSITKTACVVESGDDALMVYFPSFKTSNPGDIIRKLQRIPITKDFVITDSNGKAIGSRFVVPGQEIKITFRYQMRGTGELVEGDEKHPVRLFELIDCQKIVLAGETLKLKEGISLQEVKDNVLIGTILTVSANRLQMYVEGGRVFDNGFEYLARGQYTMEVDNNTKILDTQSRSIQASELKPFQRVQVKLFDSEWMDFSDSSPTQFAGGICGSVQMLEYGDKFIASVVQFHKMSCAVISQQTDESGNVQLLVQPDPGTRERSLQPQFILTPSDYSTNVNFSTYKTGARIDVSYLAIKYDSKPGEIRYVSEIKPNGLPAKTPEQMSEVFGNPGDVTLTAIPASTKVGAKTVSCVWENKTDKELGFGQHYTLERKNGDKWSKYGSSSRNGTDYGFTDEGYTIPPRGEAKFSYGMLAYTDLIEKGTYRIKTNFTYWRAPGDYDLYTVYAEFMVN